MVWFSALTWAQTPTCPPMTAADVVARAHDIERVLVEDTGRLIRARAAESELLTTLACVNEPFTPFGAAVVLQVRGFTAFLEGDTASAHRYFTSARIAVPDLTLSPELAPHSAHPIARAWADARWNGQSSPLPPAADGVWFVNGRPAPTMPRDLPAVLQYVQADGSARQTAIVTTPPAGLPVRVGPVRPAPVDPAPQRPLPVKFTAGLALGAAGLALLGEAASRSDDACVLPDDNGDGRTDCPRPLVRQYAAGVGIASAGAGLTLWGVFTEFRARPSRTGGLRRPARP